MPGAWGYLDIVMRQRNCALSMPRVRRLRRRLLLRGGAAAIDFSGASRAGRCRSAEEGSVVRRHGEVVALELKGFLAALDEGEKLFA